MKNIIICLALISVSTTILAQVKVVHNSDGMRLVVGEKDFMINGMNWDYFPIGTNFSYSLWKQSDDVIKAALDAEMSLLKSMGVNTIRQYTGVQPKWIQYIYDNYGIYTMLNHSFGRYGLTINGVWTEVTDYRDPETQNLLISEVTKMAEEYKGTPGVLLFLLGNENNYGLFWAGSETEDFPDGEEEKKYIGETRGRPMYKLMNEAAIKMKERDQSHPVALCNGDVLFLDIVAEECKDVDIYGVNMYRGVSFGNAFVEVRDKVNKPIMFTEFGTDAFNAIDKSEDQLSQAYYMVGNWKEIYQNAAGLAKAGNSIGGFTFQFSDGWWKFGQTKNLDVHDNNASWSNGGYERDYLEGENNMNEEWFGICAKGPTNERGLYQLYPRAAYYALKEAHALDPYADGVTSEYLDEYFSGIELMDAVNKARGDQAALIGEETRKVRLSGLRAEFSTFSTGGDLLTTPSDSVPNNRSYPDELGFDHKQSYFAGIEAKPTESIEERSWQMVWQDEFDGPAGQLLDEAKWTYDIGTDWGNAQLEYDTDRPENVSLDGNGNLAIIARKESFAGSAFTSARVTTEGLFDQTYGRFEARIKMPLGPGMWPAFWMLGSNISNVDWPQCGEIDVMEYRGQQPQLVHGSVHGPGYSGGAAITKSFGLPASRFDVDFHVFAVEWGEDYLHYFVDNTLYQRIEPDDVTGEWVYNHPFYIILNLAVGGNYVGFPTEQTLFPQTMLVDYVRVFREGN